MKRFKRLTEMEIAMCESVGEDSQLSPQWQAQTIPSEEELGSFRKRIEELEEKKVSLFVARRFSSCKSGPYRMAISVAQDTPTCSVSDGLYACKTS